MLVAVVLLAVVLAPGSFAMNHWLVTEEGKIEYQVWLVVNLIGGVPV